MKKLSQLTLIVVTLVIAGSLVAATGVARRFQGLSVFDKIAIGELSDALLFGMGTSSNKATTSTANKNFVEFRTESTATTGDSRGIYNKLNLNGTGVSGEATRSYTYVDKAAGNAHGVHASLGFGVSPAALTGQGAAMRSTLHIPDRATMSGGTYYSGLSEINMDGTNSSAAGLTQVAIHSFQVMGGDATAQKTVKNALAVGFQLDGDSTGNMVYTHTHTPGDAAGSIRILVCNNGTCTPRYLKFWAAE